MPIPTVITDLSTTPASNSPSGSDSPIDGDNFLRTYGAFIRQNYDSIATATAAITTAAADLADTSDTAKGDALIGVKNTATGGVARTQHARNEEDLRSSDFSTLQQAVTAAAGKRLLVLGSHTITSAITVLSDTEIVLTPGSEVNTSTADISHFDCTGRSNVRIHGPGKIKKTGTGTAAYVAGVLLTSASNCIVYGVEFEGMQWAGVYMKDATNCHAVRNYIHDHLGTVQDAAGVYVGDDSLACHVDGNRIANSGWHGVAVIDTDATAGVVPVGTHVCNNEISGQTAYGITVYELSADNSDTLVLGNRVRDVTGANPTGAGGAGIYVQNSGGVRVIGNIVRNVCTSTSSATLTPAGIGVNNAGSSLVPAVVSANTITNVGITSGGTPNSSSLLLSGINVSSSASGADVSGNVIVQGALTTPTFAGLYCNATSNYSATGNKISLYTSGSACVGIFAYANGANIAGINLVANEVVGGTSGGQYILITNSGGFTASGISISGGVYRGAGSSCRGLQIEGGVGASIVGAQIYATGEAVYLNGTTKARFSGCALESSGSTAILTAGTCTDSYMDASNYWGTAASAMNNGGTGFRVEWIGGTSAPAAGTWAVNDRTIRGTQAVGSPKAWVCTVAGTSGTHTSEGNL